MICNPAPDSPMFDGGAGSRRRCVGAIGASRVPKEFRPELIVPNAYKPDGGRHGSLSDDV
jgi:hypothetical protein